MSYKCAILANPEGQAWNLAHAIYDLLRRYSDNFELNRVAVRRFRDGESKVKIETNVRRRDCYFIHDSNLPPDPWVTQLLLVNEALRNSSAHEVIDVLPYLKFSRQDRKDESRVAQSAKALKSVIQPFANRILTVDVHNPAIQGFYDIPFDNLYSFPTVVRHLQEQHTAMLEDIVIMSPDTGGAKRAEAFTKKLGKREIAIGYKTRQTEGEVENISILGDVKNKKVLMVDDILDSGNTLVKACVVAREQGAKEIYAYCTHALFTKGIEDVASNFDKIFISDTITQPPHEKLERISLILLLAEAIGRTNDGRSLSELFE